MTRARNGAALAAPTRAREPHWHVIPDDDDRGPYRTFPACADGDELLARLPSGEVVTVTVDRRGGGAFRDADGEAVEPDAIAVPPPRSRSGKHKTPRITLHASAKEFASWGEAAETEGLSLSEWLREAARAYERIAKRPDGVLTDADWRAVVRG